MNRRSRVVVLSNKIFAPGFICCCCCGSCGSLNQSQLFDSHSSLSIAIRYQTCCAQWLKMIQEATASPPQLKINPLCFAHQFLSVTQSPDQNHLEVYIMNTTMFFLSVKGVWINQSTKWIRWLLFTVKIAHRHIITYVPLRALVNFATKIAKPAILFWLEEKYKLFLTLTWLLGEKREKKSQVC